MKHLLTTLALALSVTAAHAAAVTLEVDGLDTTRLEGASLMVAVFTEAGSWLRQPVSGQRFVLGAAAASGRITVVLKDLPEGPIALSLFQDANGNGKLDMNMMGMPTEPYGFSNNASGNFGPPPFDKAVFTPEPGKTARVTFN